MLRALSFKNGSTLRGLRPLEQQLRVGWEITLDRLLKSIQKLPNFKEEKVLDSVVPLEGLAL